MLFFRLYQLLRLLGSETLDALLSGTLQSLPSLAQELGKEPVAVRIDDNGYRVRTEARGILQNVFMHVLRNSIDHGIEMPAARLASGKSEAGRLSLSAGHQGGNIVIEIVDDGDGVDRNPTAGTGAGLQNLADRMGAQGGSCEAGPGPDGGFVIRAGLPAAVPGRTGIGSAIGPVRSS